MGKQFDRAWQLDDTYVMHTFARKPVEFVSGAGQWLIDDEGNEYLDFLSGIGVVSVGHCKTRVTEAVTEQANKLLHVSNYFYIEHRGELAERISDMLAHGTDGVWQTFLRQLGCRGKRGRNQARASVGRQKPRRCPRHHIGREILSRQDARHSGRDGAG